MLRICLSIMLLLFVLSCQKDEEKSIYKQGRLEYRIKYLNAEKENYDPSFLPKKMIMEFNQDYSINRIDGFMGFFKLGNITYFKSRKVMTHLKVLDQNFLFSGERNEMMCCFECMDDLEFEEDTTNYRIGGLISKKVVVRKNTGEEQFDIYYTMEIDLSRPNVTNPYRNIGGVLTKFRLTMGPYLMQFTAVKFDPKRSPKEEMIIPKESKAVSRNEMVAILNRLMKQNL